MRQLILAIVLATQLSANSTLFSQAPAQKRPAPQSQQFAGLHNVFKVNGDLYSGSSPTNDAGFAALAAAGIKVIISVDGAKPDVERARKHGLRYVHLPIGYDGIPKQRLGELVKAAARADGGIYVHCHHGKHRGPAAAAVICQGLHGWNAETATTWMHQAGTSSDYAGLYRDIRHFEKPAAAALEHIPAELPEIAPTPPLVDTMVALDDYFQLLKSAQAREWREIPAPAELTPVQVASLLGERFRELRREPATSEHGPDYQRKLQTAEETAADLITALRARQFQNANAALERVNADCTRCHKAHRN